LIGRQRVETFEVLAGHDRQAATFDFVALVTSRDVV
jgi:hypothetical protein